MTLFLDNSYYSFHRMRLKLGGQLDYEVVQVHIVFRLQGSPEFESLFIKDCSGMTFFRQTSSVFTELGWNLVYS